MWHHGCLISFFYPCLMMPFIKIAPFFSPTQSRLCFCFRQFCIFFPPLKRYFPWISTKITPVLLPQKFLPQKSFLKRPLASTFCCFLPCLGLLAKCSWYVYLFTCLLSLCTAVWCLGGLCLTTCVGQVDSHNKIP